MSEHPWPYSADIAAAWEVVLKVGQWWRICTDADGCIIETPDDEGYMSVSGLFEIPTYSLIAEGTTAPLAICLAALKAAGVKVPA